MRQPAEPSPEETAKPHDELPTSSRWRHIPEPQPLVAEQANPVLTPRRMAVVAGMLLCMVSGIVLFLKSSNTPSASPVDQVHSASLPTAGATSPGIQEFPAPNRTAHQITSDAVPLITADDRKIDQVLRLYTTNPSQDHSVTAQVLINLLPSLSKHGQVEGARHIANLLPDSDYERVMPIWRNARSDRDVIEILGSDLVNRDPKIMLPAMLETLRQPSHPFRERAMQALQLFLDADYGSDLAKWDEATRKFVATQTLAARTGGG